MNEKMQKIRKSFPDVAKFNIAYLLTAHKRFSRYQPDYSMSKKSMAYVERVTPLQIDYVVRVHADDRLKERRISEYDMMETITHGSFEKLKDNYMYKFKYLKVIVDREVTDSTERVGVITAMFSYDFVKVVRTCQEKFMANRTVMTNALRYLYDEMGEALYTNHKKVFKRLEENGFVYRDSFFGESVLSSYRENAVVLDLGENVSLGELKSRLTDVHDEILNGNPASVLSKRWGLTARMVCSFTEDGRKYVYTRSAIPVLSGAPNKVMRSMVKGTTQAIRLHNGDLKVLRGARYDLVMVEVGDVSWIIDFAYHRYFLELRDTYVAYAISRSEARTFLNTYVNALGMYVYAKDGAELKHRFLVKSINELNRRKVALTRSAQDMYLEERGLTFG